MRTKTRLVCVLVAGSAALVPLGFTGCGGGGSSSGGGSLPQQSLPPAATLVGWSPADSELHQYRSYTFTATGTDPNIGGGVKEFVWDFGDGTPTVTTTSQAVNGKAQATCTHSFTAAGSVSVSVVARNNAGLSSPAATKALTVMADASPLQASFTTPAAPVALNVALGSTVDLAFVVHVANSGNGTVSAAGVKLEAGDTGAQVQAPRDLGNGNWGITVAYPAATALGTREITPAVQVVDSNGVSSERVSGPKVTVRTVSAQNGAPVVGLESTPAIVAGVNATYQGVSIAFKATASDPDGDPLTYAWTFGDGGKGDVAATQDAAQLAQTHVYDKPGVYPVVFTANDGRTGGVKTITLNLNILANTAPSLSVAMDPAGSTPFANVPINFLASSTDGDGDLVTVSWDFGDGTPVVTGPAQMHSFPASGPTVVKVTADDGKGGVATRTLNLDVQVNRPPVAKVETAAASLYQKKEYTFTASATDPDGNPIQRYEWDFGDGTGIQLATGTTIKHVFASTFTGKASVKVRAVDNRGSVGDFSPATDFTIRQTSLPVVSFLNPAAAQTYNTELGGSVVVPIILRVTNPNAGAGSYLPLGAITFNMGETATLVSSAANGDGTYTYHVRYSAASAVGQRTITPSASAVDQEGIAGQMAQGPQITINTQSTNRPPVVTMVSTPRIPAGTNATWQNVAIEFKATASDPDSDAMTYAWTFGDGGKGDVTATPDVSALTQAHTFSAPGVYPVVFTANDNRTGGSKSVTLNLNILANTAPSLSVAMDPAGSTPFANVPINFLASSTDGDGDLVTVSWDFGDGTPVVTGPAQMHSFPASGPTVVKVTADDGKGGVATRTLNLDVQVNRPPVAKVETAAANRYQNKAYTFTASATDPDGNPIQRYEWDFGDGTGVQTSATNTIQHTYASTFTGKASAKVRGVDSHGSVGDFSPAVDFTVVQTQLPVVSFVSPLATTLHVELAGTVDQGFVVRATNPNGAAGSYLPVDAITFQAGDPSASVVSSTANGDGTYTFLVRYSAASAMGARFSNPTARATDQEGIQGLQVTGPAMTIQTLGVNTKPEITVTSPDTPTISAYARKAMALAFTLKDADNDPVEYTVDWGDGKTDKATPTGDFSAGVTVPLTHTYTNDQAGIRTVTVTATDKRSADANAVPRSFTVTVTANAAPTAAITSPQASGTPPKDWTGSLDATTVVIPAGGKLKFVGTSTRPTSGDPVTSSWSFEGGAPSTATGDTPDEVIFAGTPGQFTEVTVRYTVKDALDDPKSGAAQFRVVVDGKNTQNFQLGYQYRLKSEDNETASLSPVVKAEHGLGTSVEIYQDGLKNTYKVQDLSGTLARVDIPVRSDLPFYVKVPSFGGDDTAYLMRIPNAPIGVYADSGLVGKDSSISRFQFRSDSLPYNPQLDIVTAQGFAPETASARERKLNGDTKLSAHPDDIRDLWIDRLSVPWPVSAPHKWWDASGRQVALDRVRFSGIPAYQEFAEWPVVMKTEDESGIRDKYRFILDSDSYGKETVLSEFKRHLGMQAYRVPKGETDPYQLSTGWDTAAQVADLKPTAVDASVKNFFQGMVHNEPGTTTPLAGGLNGLVLPYDPNDKDRAPLDVPKTRLFVANPTATFGYAEYLWSSVWARPLVLNVARLNPADSRDIASYNGFRYSDPVAWPKASITSPDPSAFDLTANGSGSFNAAAPVAVGVGAAPTTGVGRFFWTAYTPSYTGDANLGAAISRTWLSDHVTKQPPTSFPNGAASGDATSAFGFLPPQDAMVDKRARKATGEVDTSTTNLTGYRVTWFNPTRDAGGAVVAPDFWVVALTENGKETHFLLPSNYPAPSDPDNLDPEEAKKGQHTTDSVLTDARIYLPSEKTAKHAGDTVAPGYCWFDIPRELRPTTNTGVSLRVYAVKSIVNNNNKTLVTPRPLNRPDWMDAIKTATAAMVFKPADGTDLSKVHRIPFNYAWDIVVVNGPNTPVAE